jgi:MoaA/NifB/PqqE/SkfB family radical SAM enzyme
VGDVALPYILPKIQNSRVETTKFLNFLGALHARRNREAVVVNKPIDATIDLTTTCQLKCPYCSTGNGTIRRPVSVMRQDRYDAVLSDIGPEVFIIWYFSTGEPLLNKHFTELLTRSKGHEVFSAISTNLSIRLSDQRIDDLLHCGLRLIMASLDGATEETYRRYRVRGQFNLVVDNLGRLAQRKQQLGLEFPLLEWRFLRFRHNQHEEHLARSMARSLGVDVIEFFPGYAPPTASDAEVQLADQPLVGPAAEGRALQRTDLRRGLIDEALAESPKILGLPHHHRPPEALTDERKCDWLYYGTMIYPDGNVGPCCVSNDRDDDFASLDDHDNFTQVWNSTLFQKARRSFSSSERSETICDRCPMPASQHYQFGQKLRGILRIAPPWVLTILNAAPDQFFLEIDRLLLPQEVGVIVDQSLAGHLPDLSTAIKTAEMLAQRQLGIPETPWLLAIQPAAHPARMSGERLFTWLGRGRRIAQTIISRSR